MASTGWKRANGPARRQLPGNWGTIRRRVLERDGYTCQLQDAHCTVGASEVDHIRDPDNHDETNLRAACTRCHADRTKAQAIAGSKAWHARRRRPPETHPGLR